MPLYRPNTQLQVVMVLSNGDYLVQESGKPDNQWVIPKATFDTFYESIPNT